MTRRRKEHRPEEIVAKLRDADAMLNAGKDLAAVLRALEVSESTLDRWRAQYREMKEPQAVEVLCHQWAHALAWNFSVDQLINAPDTDPVEFERACHDEAWGCAYSRVWRAYLHVIRDAA
jgi:hypothetical protein